MIAQLAAVAAYDTAKSAPAQTVDDPLRQLRPSHPRLILLDSDMDRLRSLTRDYLPAKRIYGEFERSATGFSARRRLSTSSPESGSPRRRGARSIGF